MKKFIRVLSLILVLTMVMPLTVFATATEGTADPAVTLSVSSVNGTPGQTVQVTVDVSNNPGIASLKFNVAYDSVLTLTNIEFSSAFGQMVTAPEPYTNPQPITMISPLADVSESGVFATLTFTIDENAPDGYIADVSIVYDPKDIFNGEDEQIGLNVVNGMVSVFHGVPGDVNADKRVDTRDAIELFRYVAGWNVEVDKAALNVNGDSSVNTKDAIALFRYVAGWPVEITRDHTHMLTAFEAKEPTCTVDGNIAYWHCANCGGYFTDENGNAKTTLAATKIEAAGHTYSEGWIYDQENHWHAATCEHSDLTQDKAAHTFGSDKICDVCSFDISYMYKLSTPQDVTVAYDVITWTAIPNADQYTIIVNGDYEYVTRNNQCSLTSVKNSAGQTLFADRTGINKHGEVSVVVYANDNGEYTKSDNSEAVTYYYVPDAGATQSDKQSQAENYGLGLGYNMVETGFNTGMQPGMAVFDVGKLLAIDQLTTSVLGTGGDSSIYYYTSIDDYIEQQSSSNKANVSIGGGKEKLFTASLKTDLSYGSNSSYTSHKYFTSYVSRVNKQTGLVNFGGQNSDIRIHCLSQQFLQDIRRESNTTRLMTDEQLCEYLYNNYGTHTALGIIKGGYFVTSYSLWTDSIEDLNSANAMFTMAVESKVGTFFNASAGVTAQGDHTITTKGETTVSQLISSYYGGSTGVSGDKAAFTDWNLTMGSDDVPLSFSNNGAIDISSLIELFEQEYGCLGTNGVSFGEIYGQYINDRADDLYHELYDKYTYEPPFDVEVVKEEDKNVLVIDLSMYQADGKVDTAGCSYFVDGIFTVYPNMLGEDIDAVKLIGAMDKTNTEKQLLDGFSLALKGNWTRDVEIILENFGVEAKSDYGIVDSTAIPKTTNVTVSYEGISIVKDTTGIYYCYVEHEGTSCRFVLSEEDLPAWVLSNASIDDDAVYLPVAIKDNYTFASWVDSEGNTVTNSLGKLDTAHQFIEGTEILKVVWKPATYTITLNNQGATTAGTDKVYLVYGVGYAASEPASEEFTQIYTVTIPQKMGYLFDGYYSVNKDESGKIVEYVFQHVDAEGVINNLVNGVPANVAITGDEILYAKWTPIEYTVAYKANRPENEALTTDEQVESSMHTYNVLEQLSENSFTYKGYSFSGWNTKPDGTGKAYKSGEEYQNLTIENGAVVTLYAQWTENIVITFDDGVEDGETYQVSNSYTEELYMTPGGNSFFTNVECTSPLVKFQVPTRTGYTFGGFYDNVQNNSSYDPKGGNLIFKADGSLADGVDPTDLSDASQVLMALWDLNEFTATWNTGVNCTIVVTRTSSPLANAATGVITSGTTIYYGDKLTITYTAPTGYEFTSMGVTNVTVTSNVTSSSIYASAKLRTFTITYNLNKATADTSTASTQCYEDLSFTKTSYTVTYGTSYKLDVPSAQYYTFNGWYTSDGTKITNADGKSVANWTYLNGITVYAHWTKTMSDYTYVKTTADFSAMAGGNLSSKYLLIKDINLSGVKRFSSFSGVLDGGGHTISGWAQDLSTSVKTHGLFETNSGTIKNLVISGFQLCGPITNDDETHDHDIFGEHKAGLLCAVNRGTIENVQVSGSSLYFDLGSLSCDVQNYVHAGLLCGYNTGTIKNCTASGNYMNVYVGSHYQDAYAYVGGIVGGSGSGTIISCTSTSNTINVTAKADANVDWIIFVGDTCKSHGRPHLYLGGVIGHTTGTSCSGLSASNNTLSSELERDCPCGTNMEHIRADVVAYSG